MKCPKCARMRASAKFCKQGGQPLQVDLVRSHCRHVNKASAILYEACGQPLISAPAPQAPPSTSPSAVPASLTNGRNQVKKFLGEGGRKKVYLAHDTELDRDVAFALIKTEKLDESAQTRVKRAQAIGKPGDHLNIVGIFDIADHHGQPHIVIPFTEGGDVDGLIKKAAEPAAGESHRHRQTHVSSAELCSRKSDYPPRHQAGQHLAERRWCCPDRRLWPGGGRSHVSSDTGRDDG